MPFKPSPRLVRAVVTDVIPPFPKRDTIYFIDGVPYVGGRGSFEKLKGASRFKQVATRCRAPGNFSNAVFELSSKSYHHVRATTRTLKIGIPNWYVSSGVETATGGAATVQASVEFPLGTVVARFTFGGSFTGTIPDLQTGIPDALTLPAEIPNGSKVFISINYKNPAGIPFCYTDGIGADQAGGDVAQYAVSGVPNVTATGAALTNTTAGVGFFPVFLASETTVRSFTIAGDSIPAGKGDSPSDGTGFGGFAERAIGPNYPFINIANAGASVDSFTSPTSFLRRQLLAFTDAVFFSAGINNVAGGMDGFVIADNILKARLSVPFHDFYPTPMLPITTGAWTLANGTDQTLTASEAKRVVGNNLLTGGVSAPFTRVINTLPPAIHASVAGKWAAGMTLDGVHPTQACHIAIAGGITPESLL